MDRHAGTQTDRHTEPETGIDGRLICGVIAFCVRRFQISPGISRYDSWRPRRPQLPTPPKTKRVKSDIATYEGARSEVKETGKRGTKGVTETDRVSCLKKRETTSQVYF